MVLKVDFDFMCLQKAAVKNFVANWQKIERYVINEAKRHLRSEAGIALIIETEEEFKGFGIYINCFDFFYFFVAKWLIVYRHFRTNKTYTLFIGSPLPKFPWGKK